MPLVRRRALGLRMPVDYSLRWGYGGLVGPDLTAFDIAAVLNELGSRGLASTSIRPYPMLLGHWEEAICLSRWRSVQRFETIEHNLDLSGGFGEVWSSRFKADTRTRIRKAERIPSLAVEHQTGVDLLDEFYRLHLLTVERWNRRGMNSKPQAREQWLTMADKLRDALHVWIARIEGRAAAAIIVLENGRSMSYAAGAVDVRVTANGGLAYLLHSLAIRYACEHGAAYYHMGVTGTNPGLTQFKTRLGALPHANVEFVFERIPLRTLAGRRRRLAAVARRWMTAGIRLPRLTPSGA